MKTEPAPGSAEATNDRLASEHSINDYYEKSFWPIRWIEKGRLRIIREMVGPVSGLSLLEVGSGGGHVLRMFRDAQLTAVDVSGKFLEIARENLRGYDCKFLQGEIDKLALPEASFDRIVCTEVLEHIPDPAPVMREIARLLKPTGRAVITVPNDPLINGGKAALRNSPVGWVIGDRLNWGGDEFHLHQWKPAQFRQLLSAHFLVEDQHSAPFDFLPIRVCFACRRA
ncbi:MAG TPA: methyltransferase domain-containing protein [Polyangiaceae bacterium]|nr:methyltransferase domain-containing protein [Polyangiaceae bacterium]